MRKIRYGTLVLGMALLGAGCASDVVASTATLAGGDTYRCDVAPASGGGSLCRGDAGAFDTADLHPEWCDETREGPICMASPATSPGLPPGFFSAAGAATLGCPPGASFVCEADAAGAIACACVADDPGCATCDGGSDDGSVIWELVEDE